MLYECFKTSLALSPEEIAAINFVLKKPLKANFSVLENENNHSLCDFARRLQAQCVQALGLGSSHPGNGKRVGIWQLSITGGNPARGGRTYDMAEIHRVTREMIQEDLAALGLDYDAAGEAVRERLITLYLVVEALVLVKTGACTIDSTRKAISLRKTARYEHALYASWFARQLSQSSSHAELINLRRVVARA